MLRRSFLPIVAGTIAGCSGTTVNQSGTITSGSPTQTPTETAAPVGKSHEFENGVVVALRQVTLARSLVTMAGDSITADSGNGFIIASVSAKNTSDKTLRLPWYDNFAVIDEDSQFEPMVPRKEDGYEHIEGLQKPIESSIYSGVESARPGISTDGVVLFEAPLSVSNPQVSVTQKPKDAGVTGYTSLYWDTGIDLSVLPNPKLKSVTFPDSVRLGKTGQAILKVGNTGGRAGQFQMGYTLTCPGEEQSSDTISASIPPSEQRSLTLECTPTELGEISLALGDLDPVKAVVQPAKATFGRPVELPDVGRYTLGQLQFHRSYTIDSEFGDDSRIGAASGSKFAFLFIQCDASNGETTTIPRESIKMIVGNQSYSAVDVGDFGTIDFSAPIHGTEYTPTKSSGWLVYEIPASTSRSQVEISAKWGEGFGSGGYGIQWE